MFLEKNKDVLNIEVSYGECQLVPQIENLAYEWEKVNKYKLANNSVVYEHFLFNSKQDLIVAIGKSIENVIVKDKHLFSSLKECCDFYSKITSIITKPKFSVNDIVEFNDSKFKIKEVIPRVNKFTYKIISDNCIRIYITDMFDTIYSFHNYNKTVLESNIGKKSTEQIIPLKTPEVVKSDNQEKTFNYKDVILNFNKENSEIEFLDKQNLKTLYKSGIKIKSIDVFKDKNILYEMLSKLSKTYFYKDIICFDEEKFIFFANKHMFMPVDFPASEHEVAHFVEMQDSSRWIKDDFGFGPLSDIVKYNFSFEKNISKIENLEDKINFLKKAIKYHQRSSVRETKVRAIQKVIEFGDNKKINEWFNQCVTYTSKMNNWLNIIPLNPFNKTIYTCAEEFGLTHLLGKFKTQKSSNDYIMFLVEKTIKDYPLDRIMEDWNTRAEFINNHLEGK